MQIFFEEYLVGTIDSAVPPAPQFRYSPDWLSLAGAFAISTTLPLTDAPFGWPVLAPWLVNLLPEDADALRMMARILDVPHTDVLALLARVGRDTSGALSFAQRGTADSSVLPIPTGEDLEKILNELPRKPFLVGEEGVSMSLAGVQTKLSVRLLGDGRLGIPLEGTASSHILKPDSPGRLWGSVQNEAFCLRLAHRVGLPAAKVTTGQAGGRGYLLVERYDRVPEGALLRRLHQEDFCQALGLPPGAKYQHSTHHGPKGSFAQMMDRLRAVGGGAQVMQLWDMLVFNVLCGNTDAHLKNHSLLIGADGVRLAPLYDVMCAEVWPDITANLALDVGGKRVADYIEGRHWTREAEACRTMMELSPPFDASAVAPVTPHMMSTVAPSSQADHLAATGYRFVPADMRAAPCWMVAPDKKPHRVTRSTGGDVIVSAYQVDHHDPANHCTFADAVQAIAADPSLGRGFFVCAVSGPLILLLRPACLPLAWHFDLVGESRTRSF